jgi:group I intron endonuclease
MKDAGGIASYPAFGLQRRMKDKGRGAGDRRNLNNGKIYIGSSVNLGRRLSQYLSIKFLNKELVNGKSKIYSALLKYYYSNFSLEILEYCDLVDVIKREQYYMDLLKPAYNIELTAGSRLGSFHDEETKAKMRAAHIGREQPVAFGKEAFPFVFILILSGYNLIRRLKIK